MFSTSILTQLRAACDDTVYSRWIEWLMDGIVDEQDVLTFIFTA
ncbi:hypothetical protein [Chroococcidiopsis sp. CCMEE 29]|nr:hypothetical protein [Chroococcidiopsis sp. CCMEE 29]